MTISGGGEWFDPGGVNGPGKAESMDDGAVNEPKEQQEADNFGRGFHGRERYQVEQGVAGIFF